MNLVIVPRWIPFPNFLRTMVPNGCGVGSSVIVGSLFLFLFTLGAACRATLGSVSVSSTLGDAVALLLGELKISFNFLIASFVGVPWSKNGVFGCGFFRYLLLIDQLTMFLAFGRVEGRNLLLRHF